MLESILLKKLKIVIGDTGENRNSYICKALELQLNQLGFTFKGFVSSLSSVYFVKLIETLIEMRGGDVDYVPLFTNFPAKLPNDDSYYLKRVVGTFGVNLFNNEEYGANPITQMQNEEMYNQAIKIQKNKLNDSYIEFIELKVLPKKEALVEVSNWVLNQVYSPTVVQENNWEYIHTIINELSLPINVDKIVVKETLARIGIKYWEKGKLLANTPTDVLRLFAALLEQDISLATLVSFKGLKLNRAQRQLVIACLNNSINLEEDLLRYRRLWISVANYLHVGDYKVFPKVISAFDKLRNDKIKSFNSVLNKAIGEDKVNLLLTRPGVFIRNLSCLVKELGDETVSKIIDDSNKDLKNLPLPLLLSCSAALRYKGERLVINKKGKTYNIDAANYNNEATTHSLDILILQKIMNNKYWKDKKVYVDNRLKDIVIPFQVRKQSASLLNISRGSQFIINPEANTVRLFIYWKHSEEFRCDLDLSLLILDKDFKAVGRISYSHYGDGKWLKHSGDIQSAPLGATEFIDIDLHKIDNQQIKYLVPTILKYSGPSFKELEGCYAGWMNRLDTNNTKIFDPLTIAQKVEVKSESSMWTPFILDLDNRKIIYTDIYNNGNRNIENNPNLQGLAKRIMQLHNAKPNYFKLAHYYIDANLAIEVQDRKDADITIGDNDSFDVNVLSLVGDKAADLYNK